MYWNPKLLGEYKRRSEEALSLLATQAFSLLVLWSLRDWPKFQVRMMALVTWLFPASGKKGTGSLWEAMVARPARDSDASLPVQQELVRGATFRSLRWDFWPHPSAFKKAKRCQYHQWQKNFTLLTFFSSAHKYNIFWVPHEGLSIQVWREFSLDTPKLSFFSRVSWQAKRGYLTGHPEVCKEAGVFINSESSPNKEV